MFRSSLQGPAVCYLPLKRSETAAALVSLGTAACGAVEKLVIEKQTAVLVAIGCTSFILYNVSASAGTIQQFIIQYDLNQGSPHLKNMPIYQPQTQFVVALCQNKLVNSFSILTGTNSA